MVVKLTREHKFTRRYKIYKKLSEEKKLELLNSGIAEFAEKGLSGANLSRIAKNAGLSVGVIYKYYEDKNALFLACVYFALETLSAALNDVTANQENLELCVKELVHLLIEHANRETQIIRMYQIITSTEADLFSKELAQKIEGASAQVYTNLIKQAQSEGKCNKSADPKLFAFFFDSLLMMVQFSYGCDYYKERLKLYGGEDIITNKNAMETQLVRFLMGAFNYDS
ncbi:MAG: TetR/AcrR family transcriptional regulator [Treponema sp.]|nr:TetR/AcrR family transcriptional regulator [Treponema sp.]